MRAQARPVSLREVADAWWPLALSWVLMAVEQPAIAAVIARQRDPEIQLAAYGGVVFPIALVVEAPIISLLSASTELSRGPASYRALRGFSNRAGAVLTAIHLLLVATPLYDFFVGVALGVPAPVAEAGRVGLAILLPWSWAIASRRTGQGALIRHGHGRWVSAGTASRLVISAVVLAVGHAVDLPGVVVGTAALSIGVLAEAAFVAYAVRRLVTPKLAATAASDDAGDVPLRGRAFVDFYLPLALMPLVALIVQPIGAAALSRMPQVVDSLALWPVLIGLLFVFQALGISYNEVVVALVGRPGARPALRRFAGWLVALTVLAPLLLAATPLSGVWFRTVIALPDDLATMAALALLLGLPIPASRVLQSWYQGVLVAARKTRPISEAVFVFGIACTAVLATGVAWAGAPGIYVGIAAYTVGRIAQTAWLAIRLRQLGA